MHALSSSSGDSVTFDLPMNYLQIIEGLKESKII